MPVPAGLSRTFSPVRIGPVEIPNRVVRAAHFTKMAVGPRVSDDLINYHVARGHGGVGLTIIEATAVHPSSVLGLVGFDDAVLDSYARIVEAVRPTGMKLFQQLWQAGHIYPPPGGVAPRGVSRLPSPISGVPPVPIRTDEIAEFVDAFAQAARRSVSAGIDGIELAASHGYLFHQFLSPLTNDRTDDYGGSLDNRMRFLVETLTAARAAIGPNAALGVRVGAGQVTGDVSERDLSDVLSRLTADGLIDYVNVSMGDYYRLAESTRGMDQPAGYQLASSAQITATVTSVPRIVTGRFRTLEEVEQVLKDGSADLVSMVRAHIADPDIVLKTRRGDSAQVRPCIGCNQGCLARTSGTDDRLGCVVNPAIGREATLAEHLIGRTDSPQRVVIIGGGPAGLEAARTARLRGHHVVLHEASHQLGGALNLARLAPRMQGMDDILGWLRDEVSRLGVDVRLSSYVDADAVLAAEPNVVLVATGAQANLDGRLICAPGEPVVGIDSPHVLSTVDLLTQPGLKLGHRALVYDEMGQWEAVAIVEYLLERNIDVTLATRFAAISPLTQATARLDPALLRFGQHPAGFRAVTRSQLVSVETGKAVLRTNGSNGDETIAADTVVMVTYKRPVDQLAVDLQGRVPQVQVIGDALSGRDLQVAIRDGHLAGRGIV